jgi:catechol 2,3-dioxygenase-like lactoylglutathione lyase family enzyme
MSSRCLIVGIGMVPGPTTQRSNREAEINHMDHDIDTLHHLGIISRDMQATVARYEALGFMFTPLSLPKFPLKPGGQPETVGVANRNAIFQNSFLEMLGVVDAARWSSISLEQRGPFDIDKPLQRYEGLHVMHFGSDNLDAVYARLVRDGLNPSAIRPFHRMVDTVAGPQLMRAKSLSFPINTNPEALLQIAQHETPALALQPRFMQHPNGARSLSEVIVCVQDPASIAQKYAAFTDHCVDHRGPLNIIDLGLARIIVLHPDNLADVLPGDAAPTLPFLAGFTVTADLALTADFLGRQNVAFVIHDGRLLVSARDACGCAVLFEQPGSRR